MEQECQEYWNHKKNNTRDFVHIFFDFVIVNIRITIRRMRKVCPRISQKITRNHGHSKTL